MGARKREIGYVVVEICSAPSGRRVALSAVVGESSRGMPGIGRAVEVVRVAGIAVGWKPVVLPAAVTGLTA